MTRYRPRVLHYQVPVHAAHPVSVAVAKFLATFRRGLNGNQGPSAPLVYGAPGMDTQRSRYTGYASPPQIFVGYSNRPGGLGGVIQPTPGGLPGTQAPYAVTSPLQGAIATITTGQG